MFCVFFKTTWLFKGSYFEQGVTIDNKTFKYNFLFRLVAAQNKQKPTQGTKNIKIHYDDA